MTVGIKLKQLKTVDRKSIREAIEWLLTTKLKVWYTPRRVQAHLWGIGANLSRQETKIILDEIAEDSKDDEWITFTKDTRECYACTSYLAHS